MNAVTDRRLSFAFAKKHGVLVASTDGVALKLMLRAGVDRRAVAEARRHLGQPVVLETVDEARFESLLQAGYASGENAAAEAAEGLEEDTDLAHLADELPEPSDLMESEDDAPIIKLINAVLTQAVRENASDIHIEPFENRLVIRFRVHGQLREVLQSKRALAMVVVSRIKVMSKLDIAEKRLPQDGRISLRIAGRPVDVRVSTLPSGHGERVVMRLLDKQAGRLDLGHLGMAPNTQSQIDELIHKPYGIILVTGPTGSGKTTTLYAALERLNDTTRNIMTVEDPIEYYHTHQKCCFSQREVGVDVPSFAEALRRSLRMDPDVILVGEMRDAETAEIGLRAAITGHLVLSTLHTRDAISTPFRLLDMGVPAFMVSTSLQGVIAQRLVRLNCRECSAPHTPTAQEAGWLTGMLGDGEKVQAKRGMGCSACNGTGYTGRQGVYELFEMDALLTQLASKSDPGEFMRAARERMKGQTMAFHALELVRQGRTSLAEAMRIGFEIDAADLED